jgi:hypothetical protein
MSHDSASFEHVHSPSTAIARRSVALSSAAALSIVKIQKLTGERLVYNLSTESGTYYANGILVSNCDALRYACMYFDSRQPVSAAPWAPASADVECNRDPEFAAINLDLKDF